MVGVWLCSVRQCSIKTGVHYTQYKLTSIQSLIALSTSRCMRLHPNLSTAPASYTHQASGAHHPHRTTSQAKHTHHTLHPSHDSPSPSLPPSLPPHSLPPSLPPSSLHPPLPRVSVWCPSGWPAFPSITALSSPHRNAQMKRTSKRTSKR